MSIIQIVATDLNYGIGYKQDLLFKINNDLSNFRRLTEGNYVVFGRKSYESLPRKPLPNRRNVVLTTNANYNAHPSVVVVNDFDKMINHYLTTGSQDKDLFICGGSTLYEQSANVTDKIILTRIHKEADNVDTYFPSHILRDFHITDVVETFSEEYDCKYEYITYERNKVE